MYNDVKVFDVHGHVSAPNAVRAQGLVLLASNTAGPSPIMSPRRGPEFSDEAFKASAQTHVNYMDERSIDVQIIGPRPFTMLGWMEPHLLPSWTRVTNDSIFKQCEAFPSRFLGAAMLPQNPHAEDTSHCVPELERCVKELGMVAVYLTPDPSGRRDSPGMHERYWDPIYEYCQRNGLPIIIHGTNCLDPRIRIIPQNYQIGFLFEQYLATQLLSHGDVFERFPELKVCVCHCGGALDRFIKTDGHLGQRDLSRNLFFDTCGYDLLFLEAAIKQRGVHQMLFGSEAPGSGRAVRPETGLTSDNLVPVLTAFDFLTAEDKLYIMNKGPAEFCPPFTKVS
ncbi:MAG TPA: amidohydrolase family protein [Dehalococcoidia bacterium]